MKATLASTLLAALLLTGCTGDNSDLDAGRFDPNGSLLVSLVGGPNLPLGGSRVISVLQGVRELARRAQFEFTGGVSIEGTTVTGRALGPASITATLFEAVPRLAVALNSGLPVIKVFAGPDQLLHSFLPFPTSFTGGVRVALGDVNGDGRFDVIAGAGPGETALVRVFDGHDLDLLADFTAFPSGFRGGVNVAAGDVDGNGRDEIIVGADAGGPPEVRVFDGRGQEIRKFLAFESGFTGGVRVAVGDVNGDDRPEILTGAGPGGAPRVRVFDGRNGATVGDFFAYDSSFTGGVYVDSGEGTVVTSSDSSPDVRVFTPNGQLQSNLEPFGPNFRGGIRTEQADVDGDGDDDLVTAATGSTEGPRVVVFHRRTLQQIGSFFAFDPNLRVGLSLAARSVDPRALRRLRATYNFNVVP